MESIQPGLQLILDRGELLKALRAFKRGDFSVRMPMDLAGMDGEIAQAFNDVVEANESFAEELGRVETTVPESGCSSPARMCISVVLPEPFGPISPMRSLLLMLNEMSSRIG